MEDTTEEDNELLATFVNVLQNLFLLQHSDCVEYSIKLSLDSEEQKLVWKGGRPISGKLDDSRELFIKDIALVQTGKDASGFGATIVAPHSCLTLFTEDGGQFNLIASSKIEREALAEGFGMLIEKAKASWDCVIS